MKVHIMPHGWMAPETTARPKARFFTFLSVIWAGVALIGGLLLSPGEPASGSSELSYIAWLMLVPEPIFVGLAIYFRLVERPRKVPTPPGWEGPVIH